MSVHRFSPRIPTWPGINKASPLYKGLAGYWVPTGINATTGIRTLVGEQGTKHVSPTVAFESSNIGRGFSTNRSGGSWYYSANQFDVDHITMLAWVQTSTAQRQHMLSRDSDSATRVFQFRIEATTGVPGFVVWFTTGGLISITATTAVNDGVPHCVVARADSTGAYLFVDGKQEAFTSVSGDTVVTSTQNLGVGNITRGHNEGWDDGAIINTAFWTRPLSDGEIKALYMPATRWSLLAPRTVHLPQDAAAVGGASIMNQLQGANLGADLFNGTMQ